MIKLKNVAKNFFPSKKTSPSLTTLSNKSPQPKPTSTWHNTPKTTANGYFQCSSGSKSKPNDDDAVFKNFLEKAYNESDTDSENDYERRSTLR